MAIWTTIWRWLSRDRRRPHPADRTGGEGPGDVDAPRHRRSNTEADGS